MIFLCFCLGDPALLIGLLLWSCLHFKYYKKRVSKQAFTVLIKMRFAFTGLELSFKTS